MTADDENRKPGDLDDGEIAALLDAHRPALHAFVRLRMGPALAAREHCSDVIQSVCRELLQGRERFEYRGEEAFRAWLFTAATHKILQKARYHKAPPRDVAREVPISVHRELARAYSSCITPSREVSAREQVVAFEAAFDRLSEQDREIIALVRIAGLPHAEVARRLGRTVEGSRTLLRRALVRLSGLLAPGEGTGPSGSS